jgi:threonine/homoserine/homoserine lactone efflux protein
MYAEGVRVPGASFTSRTYMSGASLISSNLLFAYLAYFVGAASPGPSNLAIMSIAATQGRKAALFFALGVISGSLFWASIATLGISAALIAWSHFIVAIKTFGGLYLLWLAFKSGHTALSTAYLNATKVRRAERPGSLYTKGALLHLTNPKAILVWVSIVALSSGGPGFTPSAAIPGCAFIGCLVFSGYAVLFSMDAVRRMYVRGRRGLEGCLAVVFGIAGVRLLAWTSK